jgi:hypothetical protein
MLYLNNAGSSGLGFPGRPGFKGDLSGRGWIASCVSESEMRNENAVVAVYGSPTEIVGAVRDLRSAGFDTAKLSMVAMDKRQEWRVVGYYLNGSHPRYWGEPGKFYDEIWRVLNGWAFFHIPGIGPVLVAGPLAEWIVTALNNAPFLANMSAVGMGIYNLGISRDHVSRYEDALRAGKQLLLVHGSVREVTWAKEIIHEPGDARASDE